MSNRGYEIQQGPMNYGAILRSTISYGQVLRIDLPALPAYCGVIDYTVIKKRSSTIPFGKDKLKIFNPQILYKGQPVLMVYAPTQEQADILVTAIHVEYKEEEAPAPKTVNSTIKEIAEKELLSGVSISPPPLVYHSTRRLPNNTTQVISYYDKFGNIVVHSESSWPHHTQRAIAEITGLPLSKIAVYRRDQKNTHGESFVEISAVSALAALTTQITGRETHLSMPLPTYTPSVTIDYRFFRNDQDEICAITLLFSIDMGAFPLFTDEILDTIMGQTNFSFAPVPMEVELSIMQSASSPTYTHRDFFASIGVTAREVLIRALSGMNKESPADWLQRYYHQPEISLATGELVELTHLDEAIAISLENSDYHRKYGIYSYMKHHREEHVFISRNYLRGIGVIAGHAKNTVTTLEPEFQWSVRTTLSKDEKLLIETGFSTATPLAQWAYIAKKVLAIPRGKVSISKESTLTLPNSGPDFMDREQTVLAFAVNKSLESLKHRREREPLPIIEQTPIQEHRTEQTGELFYSWGSVVVEIDIDDITCIPFIRQVWVTTCGQEWEKDKLRGEIQEVILHKYHELIDIHNYRDMCIRNRREIVPIHITIIPVNEYGTSPISVVQTLFPAAFIQAISVALRQDILELPLSPESIAELKDSL